MFSIFKGKPKVEAKTEEGVAEESRPTWMISIGTRLLYLDPFRAGQGSQGPQGEPVSIEEQAEVVTVVGMTFYRYDDRHMRDAFDLVLEAERADGSRFFSLWYAGFRPIKVVDATPYCVCIGPVDPNEGQETRG